MPPQITLTPQEKYDVIAYIRENFIRESNPGQYVRVTPGYLAKLPTGTSKGPAVKPYHHGTTFVIAYSVGRATLLGKPGLENANGQPVLPER